ncbi:hypothetical protein SAMN05519103_09473 [Rhizobiales bacterium GAS113]|nr:hypothetical protein SAMN05519103_09473 [Rhizobiales bacterium GAS113]
MAHPFARATTGDAEKAWHVQRRTWPQPALCDIFAQWQGCPRIRASIHAASKPDAVRAGLQGSAQTLPRSHYHPPGFDIVL